MSEVRVVVDGAPGTAGAERVAVAFARLLRAAGLEVAVGSTLLFAESLAVVGLARRESVYWAGRATLLHRPEDIAIYDRAFKVFWEHARAVDQTTDDVLVQEIVLAVDGDDALENDDDDGPGADVPVITLRWSPHEVLRTRDFAAYSEAEFAEARRLMADLRLAGALKRSRRLRRSRATRATRGARPDLRRTVRRALARGGEPVTRAYLEPSQRPRRIVLLLDVSGSMEPYARAFVRFLHAAVAGRSRVEAFALGTRLTRVTRELQTRDPDAAIDAAARRVADWSGGTRLGEGLRRFNDEWGVRGMARGAIVVILSDGWDRGDPSLLGSEMARLHRVAHRIVWVNPLKATAGYAPLAQGMAAALPHVDEFVEGHSLHALEELAAIIGR
jgi:uncharacterized protein with von Willebrand factor type A (vWA) domain